MVDYGADSKNYSDFVHAIAHDFGAPLRHVEGFAALLVEELAQSDSTELADMAKRVQDAGRLAQHMARELSHLALRRLGSAQTTEILPELVAMQKRWQPNVSVSIGNPIAATSWVLDRALVSDAFDAICQNVADHAPGAELAVAVKVIDNQLVFRFTDNGPGIQANLLARVLTPFGKLQGRPNLEQVGLGINLVMQVARLHGGRCQLRLPNSGGLQLEFTLDADPTANGGAPGLLPVA